MRVIAWKHLENRGVLRPAGVIVTGNRFAIMSRWEEEGNINRYIAMRPKANCFKLVGSP